MILKQLYINGKLQRQEIDAGVPSKVINDNIDWLQKKNEQLKRRGVKNLWRYETYYNGKMFVNGPFNGLIAKRKVWSKNDKGKWDCDYIEIRIVKEMENPAQNLGKHTIVEYEQILCIDDRRPHWETVSRKEKTYYGTLKEIERKLDKMHQNFAIKFTKKGGVTTGLFGEELSIIYTEQFKKQPNFWGHSVNMMQRNIYRSINTIERKEPVTPLRGQNRSHSFRTITEDEQPEPAYKPNYKRIKREENEPYWQWNEQAKAFESISWQNGRRTKGIL